MQDFARTCLALFNHVGLYTHRDQPALASQAVAKYQDYITRSLPATLSGDLGTYPTIPNPCSKLKLICMMSIYMLCYCRYIGSSGKAAAITAVPPGADPNSPQSRLIQTLPKQLLQQSEQQARRPNAGACHHPCTCCRVDQCHRRGGGGVWGKEGGRRGTSLVPLAVCSLLGGSSETKPAFKCHMRYCMLYKTFPTHQCLPVTTGCSVGRCLMHHDPVEKTCILMVYKF